MKKDLYIMGEGVFMYAQDHEEGTGTKGRTRRDLKRKTTE